MPQWIHSLTWIRDFWYFWLIGLWGIEILFKYLEAKGYLKPKAGGGELSNLARLAMTPFVILISVSALWWLADWLLSFVFWIQTWSWEAFSAWSFAAWFHSLGWIGRLWTIYGFASLGLFFLVIFMEIEAMKVAGASGWAFFGWLMLSIIGLMLILLAMALDWIAHLVLG